jgi:hypothetical protein
MNIVRNYVEYYVVLCALLFIKNCVNIMMPGFLNFWNTLTSIFILSQLLGPTL